MRMVGVGVNGGFMLVRSRRREPIARLYAAGELGSVFGHIYMAGGNLAECFVGGRNAAREASALPPWDG